VWRRCHGIADKLPYRKDHGKPHLSSKHVSWDLRPACFCPVFRQGRFPSINNDHGAQCVVEVLFEPAYSFRSIQIESVFSVDKTRFITNVPVDKSVSTFASHELRGCFPARIRSGAEGHASVHGRAFGGEDKKRHLYNRGYTIIKGEIWYRCPFRSSAFRVK